MRSGVLGFSWDWEIKKIQHRASHSHTDGVNDLIHRKCDQAEQNTETLSTWRWQQTSDSDEEEEEQEEEGEESVRPLVGSSSDIITFLSFKY